jgi:hypothetical protein
MCLKTSPSCCKNALPMLGLRAQRKCRLRHRSGAMTSQGTCEWIGANGARYLHHVYALPVSFSPGQGGNYVYAKTNAQGLWVPIYIGEGDLADRSSGGHHQAACIKRRGATHFHCHLNTDQQARRYEEADLLARYVNAYQPDGCNEKSGG